MEGTDFLTQSEETLKAVKKKAECRTLRKEIIHK
jgi:hypothetical protein